MTSVVWPTTTKLGLGSWIDSFRARLDIHRMNIATQPGLYSIGTPTPDSPVFVTANYRLSFDKLRSALGGSRVAAAGSYILVLDTHGINVWCAASKGTFGTDELCRRIELTGLASLVNHRTLILPQLGATGVNGFEVKRRSGFVVRWGPVRAQDIPAFLAAPEGSITHTHPFHRVQFPLKDRAVLIPIEIVQNLAVFGLVLLVVAVFCSRLSAIALTIGFLTAFVGFPVFLPLLPSHWVSVKGLILGAVVSMVQIVLALVNGWLSGRQTLDLVVWWTIVAAVTPLLAGLAALLFTGSTTFASKSETVKETAMWLSLFPRIRHRMSKFYKSERTLHVDQTRCIGCKACATVCPHGVLEMEEITGTDGRKRLVARINKMESCMECGACAMNCPAEAVTVESGVGCAYALILSAISGNDKVVCGCD